MNRPFNALKPSTSVATGLIAPLAFGAPGNLDPGFADHGRFVLGTENGGGAWSVDALDDGRVFVAGGDVDAVSCSYWYYDCDFVGSNFASQLTGEGGVDASYQPTSIADVEVRDAIRLSNGKVIMVGRRLDTALNVNALAVYRLDDSGSLDTSFATEGIFELPAGDHGSRHMATSAVEDPDGRIVVAGSSDDHLIVLRLLADGTLDASFGEAGMFVGPIHDFDTRTFVERTAAAGYRVAMTGASQCSVIGLTGAGAIDNSFGTEGLAQAIAADASTCGSMVSQADGTLLLAGSADGHGFATRLLSTGATDPSFLAGAVADAMTEATALAVAGDGKVLVAGSGDPGAMIIRLETDGAVDTAFADLGRTLIDLPSEFGSAPRVNALDVGADGRVLAAGGDAWPGSPFVIQLLGDSGGESPGILSFTGPIVEGAEGGDAIVKVRRTGGKSGDVSVDYRTAPHPYGGATAVQDYAEVAGTLTWADGDASEREIIVAISSDSGTPEEYEGFLVALSDPQGGAGLGKRNESVSILPDGAPAGQFSLSLSYSGDEPSVVQVWVSRNFYYEGEVSVTVTPVSGSATAGDDFDATPVTLTWADQDTEAKTHEFQIFDDDEREGLETFNVELSNPTGGAILGPYATGQVSVNPSDSGGRSGGGGSTGWLTLLLLALLETFRSLRASGGRRSRAEMA